MLNPPLVPQVNYVDGQVLFASQLNGSEQQIINWINANGRQAIASNMTFYVSPGGSDSNNGLAPTAPFATFTAAWNTLLSNYAFASPTAVVTIQAAPGSYNESILLNGVIPGQRNSSQVIINGSVGSPDTVQLTGDPCFQSNHGALVTIQGFNLTSSSNAIFADHYAIVRHSGNDFGACGVNHLIAVDSAIIAATGNYAISGGTGNNHARSKGSGSHVYISNVALNLTQPPPGPGPTVTINGTPAFGMSFLDARQLGLMTIQGAIFSGAATGAQYNVTDNGVIFTNTSGAMVLPGNAPGTRTNGGVYD
jgi:hypothetical protein